MEFNYTVTSGKTVDEAIETLGKNLKEEGFGVLWTFNLKDKLVEKGFTMEEEYYVLEVCNPKEADRVISRNKLAGYFLPCKIVIYEEEGATKIGMPNPTSLISMLDNDDLKDIARDVETRLAACIDKSK